MSLKPIALITAAVFAITTFAAPRAEARGLGIGIGIGLGLIAASQMARASREREPRSYRHVERERSHYNSRVTRSSRDDDDAAERRAQLKAKAKAKAQAEAKAKQAAEAKAEINKLRSGLGKSETAGEPAETSSQKVVETAKPEPKKAATAPITTASADTDGDTADASKQDGGLVKSTTAVDCKRYVPAAQMTVSVPCGK